MTKTFRVIVDETKTKTKIEIRDENEIEINYILVLTTLMRISEAKFGTVLASIWQTSEGIYAHQSAVFLFWLSLWASYSYAVHVSL